MAVWYFNQNNEFNRYAECENVPEDVMERMIEFAKIENTLYEVVSERKEEDSASYEDKVELYIEKITELGRNLKESDNIRFSDGTNMHRWYFNQRGRFIRVKGKISKLSYVSRKEMLLFAKIEEKLSELQSGSQKLIYSNS